MISDIARRALATMDKGFRTPVAVVFNSSGYMQALNEDRASELFDRRPTERRTYMGLPYRIDVSQEEPIRLLDADQLQGGIRITFPNHGPIRSGGQTDAEVLIIGRALTAEQLCSIVAAWNEANDTELSRELRQAIRRFGRFE